MKSARTELQGHKGGIDHEQGRRLMGEGLIGEGLIGEKLIVGYGANDIIKNVSLSIPRGKITVLIGANACGKSTLLKAMSRLLTPRAGQVLLDGKALHRYGAKALAQRMGILPQTPLAPEGIVVADLVARGRFPHQRRFTGLSQVDIEAIDRAMQLMGISEIANKDVSALSGGQRQRVWIAMALAQETEILLLDEPTTYLDIAHQIEILDLLADINAKKTTTIVMVLHDIHLAARYADHLIALRDGRIVAEGTPSVLVTEALMAEVFGLKCHVMSDPLTGKPMIVPIGRHGTMSACS